MQIEMNREKRLASDSELNHQLLCVQAARAQFDFDMHRQEAQLAMTLKRMEARKRLTDDGWTVVDINKALGDKTNPPMDQSIV